jgi:cobalt-zinc-cadmium efflux system protein
LLLITGFMATEVVVGLIAQSLALVTDAGHMLTDAAAIVFALVAMRLAARPARGRFTWGLKRAEILSAQVNGLTLLGLSAYFTWAGVQRLVHPPEVDGRYVVVTGAVGIVVNIAATWLIGKANRTSLNVEGAFQHLLNDLYAFVGTTLAGLIVWLTGFARADAVAALLVAALMLKAGWELVRASGRVFLEAAPVGLDPEAVGARAATLPGVSEVHDLHIWEVTSGYPAASAHVLVTPDTDCHTARGTVEGLLRDTYGITHLTLQVDHAPSGDLSPHPAHCSDPHGPVHRREEPPWPLTRLKPSA